MAIVKFFKLDAPPVTWVSDAIYYIKETDTVSHYVTDINGNPFPVSDENLIALIESVDTNLAIEVQDRVNADDALQDQINDIIEEGSGDMTKAVYDINNNGKVDIAEDAEQLGSVIANLYALKTYADNINLSGGYF